MKFGIRRSFQVLAPGASLRRRVGYSLAVVRLILVPVIVLSVYYLLKIGYVVDRIVSYDAPAATLSQQASIQMLEARHMERNYLLLYDPTSLQANRDSVRKIEEILTAIRDLHPSDQNLTDQTLDALHRYSQRFETAVRAIGEPGQAPEERIDAVVTTYEKDLDNLLKSDRYKTRAQLVDELRTRVGSFDAQITKTVQEGNPALRHITADLQSSGQSVLDSTAQLEHRSWSRIEFDIQGEGEVVQLANSIRLLISHLRERIARTLHNSKVEGS